MSRHIYYSAYLVRSECQDRARIRRMNDALDHLSSRAKGPGWIAALRRRLRQSRDRLEAYVLRDEADAADERADPFAYRGISRSDFAPVCGMG